MTESDPSDDRRENVEPKNSTYENILHLIRKIISHTSTATTISTIGLIFGIPGTIIAYDQLNNQKYTSPPDLSVKISDPSKCSNPCAIIRYDVSSDGNVGEIENVFIFYNTDAMIANQTSTSFIISNIDVVHSLDINQGFSSTSWIHAQQVDVADNVRNFYKISTGVIGNILFPISIKPGDILNIRVGGQFPASKSFVDSIRTCVGRMVKNNRIKFVKFSAPKAGIYDRYYSTLPRGCLYAAKFSPSGAKFVNYSDHIAFFYKSGNELNNFIMITGMNDERRFFRIERSSFAGEFSQYLDRSDGGIDRLPSEFAVMR